MRLFVAANLADQLKEALAQLQGALKAKGGDVSWVKPENLHITLKFLGEVGEERLQEIKAAIASSVVGISSFSLSFGGLGAFPNLRSPRVIWIGVKEGGESLSALHSHVEEAFEQIGFPREGRPFTPHLTLGRVRSLKGLEGLVEGLNTIKADALGGMVLERVDLMQSRLHPAGAIYTALESFPLQT